VSFRLYCQVKYKFINSVSQAAQSHLCGFFSWFKKPQGVVMVELRHGTATLQLPEMFPLPEKAGKMDPLEVSRIAKVPTGIGRVCDHAADALEKTQDKFPFPDGVTPKSLREAGQRADKIEQVLQDIEVLTSSLRQAALLYKAEAFEQVSRVNDLAKAYGKRNREYWSIFGLIHAFFKKLRARRKVRFEIVTTPPESDPVGASNSTTPTK
jgi:hypothetical protein